MERMVISSILLVMILVARPPWLRCRMAAKARQMHLSALNLLFSASSRGLAARQKTPHDRHACDIAVVGPSVKVACQAKKGANVTKRFSTEYGGQKPPPIFHLQFGGTCSRTVTSECLIRMFMNTYIESKRPGGCMEHHISPAEDVSTEIGVIDD